MTKRAEELAEFPPRLKVNTEAFRIKYVSGFSALLADSEVNNPEEPKTYYISMEEHQAILAASEKDALNSEVVKEMESALQSLSGFPSAAKALEKLSKARNT